MIVDDSATILKQLPCFSYPAAISKHLPRGVCCFCNFVGHTSRVNSHILFYTFNLYWTDVDGRDGRGRTGRTGLTWTDGTDVDGRDGRD